MEERKRTGYPSIDKPWFKFYSEEAINAKLPENTIYGYMYECNREHPGDIALHYFGKETTYSQLFEHIDEAARAFAHIGVKRGDIVSLCAVTTPETVFAFYGLNKLGAISNMIDPRTSEEGIKHYLNETDCKVLLILDAVYPKMARMLAQTSVGKVIIISPADSMPWFMKLAYRLTQGKNTPSIPADDGFIRWPSFIAAAQGATQPDYPGYVKDAPAIIMHTGGTTGLPKGVLFSDDSYNVLVAQTKYAGLQMERGHRFLGIMPPFIAYGMVCGIHIPLCTGSKLILIPKFDPQKFDALVAKYKPNHVWGVPTHYESLLNSKKLAKADLSFLIRAGVGGDGLNTVIEEKINTFLASHHCNHKVIKGYGMTELNSAVSACTDESNQIGSVGIPLVNTTISIFEPGTQKELSYHERGEICVSGPAMMLCYYKNEAETNNIVKTHSDGQRWVHTGDIGYMTEDGLVYVVDRIKRMIVRHDGFKVYPSIIENVITQHEEASACAVVGIPDSSYRQGTLPKAFVVLRKNCTQQEQTVLEEIETLCKRELAEYAQPTAYTFRDSLPLTPIGKIDYRALEQEEPT